MSIRGLSVCLVYWFLLSSWHSGLAETSPVASNASLFKQALRLKQLYPAEQLTIQEFPLCLQYTCNQLQLISIGTEDWRQLVTPLEKVPANAAMERAMLAEVISRIEIYIGRVIGTSYDLGGTFPAKKKGAKVRSLQLDCIDEAFNMYVYMSLLRNDDKLRWHNLGELVHRGWLLDGKYPHTAYTLREKGSSQRYVVDSWFLDAGRPPVVLPVDIWESGWVPE